MKLAKRIMHNLTDIGTELFWLAIVCVGLFVVVVGVCRDIQDWACPGHSVDLVPVPAEQSVLVNR